MTRSTSKSPLTRRGFLAGSAALCGAATFASRPEIASASPMEAEIPPEDYKIVNGRINHSVMSWCYEPMPMETLIDACDKMGMPAMEGIDRKYYPMIRKRGMAISLVASHGFTDGPLFKDNHAMCIAKMKEAIDVAVEYQAKSVITFTGMRVKGVSDRQAMKNCVDCWKQVIGYAEDNGVTLVLEHLNTRDDTHPMKGHPGYFGDDVDLCIDLIKKVDSPRMKLLFDIYHVQVMNGDVIRRIRQYKDYIGHMHTAGVPGRNELVDTQEVNFPAIMKVILEVGYDGYVAHEFIPTWDDKLGALRHGVRVCDV